MKPLTLAHEPSARGFKENTMDLNTASPFHYVTRVATLDGSPFGKIGRLIDGKPAKVTAPIPSILLARTVPVPDLAALLRLLVLKVKPGEALILGFIPGTETGELYHLWSRDRLEERLDRKDVDGLHLIDGKQVAARLLANFKPSAFRLFDRDAHPDMPPHLRAASVAEWEAQIEKLQPGFAQAGCLDVPSSSARILLPSGEVAFPSESMHRYVEVVDPTDRPDRYRAALKLQGELAGLTFLAKRRDRTTGAEIPGGARMTITDLGVLSPERLVFEAPTAEAPLTLAPMKPVLRQGPKLDTRAARIPDSAMERAKLARTGLRSERAKDGRVFEVEERLQVDDVIDTRKGPMTVRAFYMSAHKALRAQTPFRESSSWAAKLGRHKNGSPFLLDTGGPTKYVLDAEELDKLRPTVEEIEAAVADGRNLSDPPVLDSLLHLVLRMDEIGRARAVAVVAKACKVGKGAVEKLLKRLDKPDGPVSDHEIALHLLESVEEETGAAPVGTEGVLYIYGRPVWEPVPEPDVAVQIAERYPHLTKLRDYRGAARHAMAVAGGSMDTGPAGVAAADGFYRIVGQDVRFEPHHPDHRSRFVLPFAPDGGRPEGLLDFLARRLDGDEERINAVRQFFGGTLFGTWWRYRRVFLAYSEGTGTGKTTTATILQRMMPGRVLTSVAPTDWGDEYHRAALHKSAFNFAGELSRVKALPDDLFKQVVGGDPISARLPYGQPFTFVPRCAHWFNSNHLPITRDNSEAFFERWVPVAFGNPTAFDKQDARFAEKLVAAEGARILGWAFQGAIELEKARPTLPSHSLELIRDWRLKADSVAYYLEACEGLAFGSGVRTYRGALHKHYTRWCREHNLGAVGYPDFAKRLRALFGRHGLREAESGKKAVIVGVTAYDPEFDAQPEPFQEVAAEPAPGLEVADLLS